MQGLYQWGVQCVILKFINIVKTMPTYKEVSKIKSDFIAKREDAISASLAGQQSSLYDKLLSNFIKIASNKVDGKEVNTTTLQVQFKKYYNENFNDVMKQTINASKSLTDLNQMYFSTLLDSADLDKIHENTKTALDKSLGITDTGKLIQGGFTDKALDNKKVQKLFVKEVNIILSGNPDVNLMQNKLKDFIIGNKNSTGILERYYRNFASDLLKGIDRGNSLIYAETLELNDAFYGGGLKLTSRPFCIKWNNKIVSREQIDKWPNILNTPSGPQWSESAAGKYDPYKCCGGHGCDHVLDWITPDIARALKSENNTKAKEKNQAFKDRNDL